jgi:hypothetical protein
MRKPINNLEPASSIITIMGGCRAVAGELKLCPSTVSRWSTSSNKKGTDGRIPQKYWLKIIEKAQQNGIPITLTDLAGIK